MIVGRSGFRVDLRISDELRKALDRIAEQQGRSRNTLIVMVLEQYVEQQQQDDSTTQP